MHPSEWREFPSAPCLAGKQKTWRQLASRCCWNRARPWHASELVSFLVGLTTYQHPDIGLMMAREWAEIKLPWKFVLCTTGYWVHKSVDVGTTQTCHLKSTHVVFIPCYQYCKYGCGARFRDLDRPASPIYMTWNCGVPVNKTHH